MFNIRPSNINLKNWLLSRTKIAPLCFSHLKILSFEAFEGKGITDEFRKLGIVDIKVVRKDKYLELVMVLFEGERG